MVENLKGVSGLQGFRHHFSAPVDEDKVLFLDNINKDILFLLTVKDFFMMEVTEEIGIYCKKSWFKSRPALHK